jgi:hypothetical protein
VDLAYATTGHRAQGLTRGRALVPLNGSEDVNWLYVQLARALSRAGGQTLAVDTPYSLDLQRLSTAELRTERDRLRRQLDQAPATAPGS